MSQYVQLQQLILSTFSSLVVFIKFKLEAFQEFRGIRRRKKRRKQKSSVASVSDKSRDRSRATSTEPAETEDSGPERQWAVYIKYKSSF